MSISKRLKLSSARQARGGTGVVRLGMDVCLHGTCFHFLGFLPCHGKGIFGHYLPCDLSGADGLVPESVKAAWKRCVKDV